MAKIIHIDFERWNSIYELIDNGGRELEIKLSNHGNVIIKVHERKDIGVSVSEIKLSVVQIAEMMTALENEFLKI